MEPAFCYGNGSCVRTVYPVIIRATLYLGLGSAVVLTVLGNLLVIVAIAHFKQLHTPTNYLTLSLAASDLLLGVLVMLPSMVRAVETCWYFGEMFCMIYTSYDVLLCNASILNLSFISIDRYYAVCHPLLYPHKITVHTALVMILITWCVSAVVGFGMIFLKLNLLGVEEIYYNHVACEGGCILFQSAVSGTVASILSFYIPGVIMLGIYLKIYMVAQRQARTIGLQNTSSSKVDKHQRKATKTLAIIMGVFLAFWTPFFICNIIDPFIGYSVPPTLFDTLVWAGGEQQLCYPGSNISCPRAEFHLGAQVALYTVFVLGHAGHGWAAGFYGHAFCLLHSAFDMFLTSVSIFHLICIAVGPPRGPGRWPALYSYGLLYSKANVQGLEEYLALHLLPGQLQPAVQQAVGTLDTVIAFFLPCTAHDGLVHQIFLVAREHARKIEGHGGQGGASNGFSTPAAIFEVFVWLGYFNSTLNPVIYALFYPWFRKTSRLIFTLKIFTSDSSSMNVTAL
ncbi:hypothetical protein CRUP_015135 [Coryphaenoides rupestris]|nr:hypothetical protein CRUP_015135 [Coryphaenoides rupestris]